jgi:hypothetical protein
VSVSNTEFIFQLKLPPRKNRGIPPKRYVPEDGSSKTKEYPIINYCIVKNLPKLVKSFATRVASESVPERVEDALANPKWVEAMRVEIEALNKNCTWKLIELPEGKKLIGCKWVYSIKYRANGEVERYKTKLVAKGDLWYRLS